MSVQFEDNAPRISVNPRDVNKILIQEVNNEVKIAASGPQGVAGPAGAAGAQGPQGPAGTNGTNGEPGRFTVSETAPVGPVAGDAWFRSSTAQLYLYYDSYWVETSTSYAGPVGAGVATGGTAGQVLSKVDSTNYNTQWVDASTVGAPSAVRWSPTFQATGLTFTGTNSTYPTYNSYYVKFGQLVSFNIQVNFTTVTDFGTGQFKVDLPFAPMATAANHYSAWCWVDPSQPADELNGHIQLVADHVEGSQTMDLHWLLATTANPKPIIESLWSQGTPVTLTTASKLYINGTYISAA